MSEENIFNSATTEENKGTKEFQIPTEVSEFVGADKKYKSIEDALKSVPHAQGHIQKLEEELASLREEVTKRKSVEEVLQELRAEGLSKSENTTQPSIDPNQLAEFVSQVVERRETQKTAKQNADMVVNEFKAKFGNEAEAKYIEIAKENGLDVNTLNSLASKSPEAVLKLAGIEVKKTSSIPASLSSSINPEALNSTKTTEISAKVTGRSTKDIVDAWKRAGQKVTQNV